MPRHDEHYDRADEYTEAYFALWKSWQDDAFVFDKDRQLFADPAKVHRVYFSGQWHKTQGPFAIIPSPRSRPFLCKAGHSNRGKTFVTRDAEGIFSAARDTKQKCAHCEYFVERTEHLGREPADIPVFWTAGPPVAESASEARVRFAENRVRIPLEVSLAQMCPHWNLDLSQFDIDRPVTHLDVPGTNGLFETCQKSDPNITLRYITKTYLSTRHKNPFVRTLEQVANAMQHLMEEGRGDGFQVAPPYHAPDYFTDPVNLLVPALPKRGVFRKDRDGGTLQEYLAG